MKLPWDKTEEPDDMKEALILKGKNDPSSDAPFSLQFAPGVMIFEAEIRDRKSLAVFVAAAQALGQLLPENEDAAPTIAVTTLPPPKMPEPLFPPKPTADSPLASGKIDPPPPPAA